MNNPIETLSHCLAHAVYQGMPDFEYEERTWAKAPVIKTCKHTHHDVNVEAMFMQTWPSTSLGFGGIGGQALTDAYTVVISSRRGPWYCVYFGGRFAYWLDNPARAFFEDIANRDVADMRTGKLLYEQRHIDTEWDSSKHGTGPLTGDY